MSALIPVNVEGVEFQAHGEYTSEKVAQEFQNSLAAFVNIFNVGLPNSKVEDGNGVVPADSDRIIELLENDEYVDQLTAALTGGSLTRNFNVPGEEQEVNVLGLFNLLKDGLPVENDPVLSDGQYFLSMEMVTAVQQLVKTLQMAGADITIVNGKLQLNSPLTPEIILNWKNLSASSDAVRAIMQYAVDTTGDANRTLQALVELIYVRAGNELLSDKLEVLETGMSATKGSLDALNRLQSLHNLLEPDEGNLDALKKFIETINSLPTTGVPTIDLPLAELTLKRLNEIADGTFEGIPELNIDEFDLDGIDPKVLNFTEQNIAEFIALRNEIVKQIAALEGVIKPEDEEGSLLGQMREVLNDIDLAYEAADIDPNNINNTSDDVENALRLWVLGSQIVRDKNDELKIDKIGFGQIQRNITAAITAGQSLNDTQKEEVRRILFVFEEYYKSAAAILSKITQILERMAQAIAR